MDDLSSPFYKNLLIIQILTLDEIRNYYFYIEFLELYGEPLIVLVAKICSIMFLERLSNEWRSIMFRRVLILTVILSFVVSGCNLQPDQNDSIPQTPKFEVAADKQNYPVNGLTPEIQEELIQSYLSDIKTEKSREDFKRVVNTLKVQKGKFLVRVKDCFSIFCMDNHSKKIFLF